MHGYKWPIISPRTRTGLMALLLEAGGDEWIVMNSSFRSRIRCQMVVGSSDVAPVLTAHVVDPTAAAARHIYGMGYTTATAAVAQALCRGSQPPSRRWAVWQSPGG